MIKTGVDVAEIQRFREMEHLDAFVKRVFTKQEQAYFSSKKNPYESIAGHYAAKEAFSKYMGTGMRGFGFKDIEVFHDELGKPYLMFLGHRALVDLSMTHSQTVAVAVVCGEESVMEGTLAEYFKTYRAYLPKRWEDMHKGDAGKVFVVAGSKGMTGAATLCAEAAMRSGSGLVTVGTPDSEQPILAIKLTEAMTLPLPSQNGMLAEEAKEKIREVTKNNDVTILGPGLGKVPKLWEMIAAVLREKKAVVLDADGLNALAEHIDILSHVASAVVLTPHAGEMARMLGCSVQEVQENRCQVAVEFAKKWGVTLLLKGKDTVIASPTGQLHVNPTGNHGMASGGMGDVLSGMIGSLLGQGLDGYQAAVLGAFLHGLAGDIAAKELGEFSLLATDLLRKIPNAFLALQKNQ